MEIVAGIDIGNATTEVALAKIQNNKIEFLSSSIVPTTGIKGTKQNINGVFNSLRKALDKANLALSDLDRIRVNEAAPVIGDVAMETITETIITESTMIGHKPKYSWRTGSWSRCYSFNNRFRKSKRKRSYSRSSRAC